MSLRRETTAPATGAPLGPTTRPRMTPVPAARVSRGASRRAKRRRKEERTRNGWIFGMDAPSSIEIQWALRRCGGRTHVSSEGEGRSGRRRTAGREDARGGRRGGGVAVGEDLAQD